MAATTAPTKGRRWESVLDWVTNDEDEDDDKNEDGEDHPEVLFFPQRDASEAAVMEWGHSAVISALDGVVATFGPQTSRGTFFGVETAPILASPLTGVDLTTANRYFQNAIAFDHDEYGMPVFPLPLDNNFDEMEGNMMVMTNGAGLSGVQMAKLARDAGAAALCVVNVLNHPSDNDNNDDIDHDTHRDYIYPLSPMDEMEEQYAEQFIDFPVVMISLNSGNILTTATLPDEEDEDVEEDTSQMYGMPDRIRLYAAGDRPFFEDISADQPLVYLIHNLLSVEECDMLRTSVPHYQSLLLTPQNNNFLEHSLLTGPNLDQPLVVPANNDNNNHNHNKHQYVPNNNIERAMLWKGPYLASHALQQLDERIEQVTGYPQAQFSNWQITKYTTTTTTSTSASKLVTTGFHTDHHPLHPPLATVTVFLNTVPTYHAGTVVFPHVNLQIQPTQGLAIVHHTYLHPNHPNVPQTHDPVGHYVDDNSLHGDLPLLSEYKYVAKKFVYADVCTSHTRNIILPLLARGKTLPRMKMKD